MNKIPCLQSMLGLLYQLNILVNNSSGNSAADKAALDEKIKELTDIIMKSNNNMSESIDHLQSCSTSIGDKYHWLIFVVLYGGSYFLMDK